MENQAVTNPIPEPITPPVQLPKPKAKFPIMYLVLSLLSLLFLASTAFLYYQNIQLKSILATYQTSNASPTPTATIDLTADWETYTNSENGYSIKFPKTDYIRFVCPNEELTATKRGADNQTSPVMVTSCARDSRYDLETKTYISIQKEPEETKYYDIVKKDVQMGGVLGKLYIHTFTNIEDGPYPKWFAIALVNKNNKTYEIYFSDKEKLDLFNQILSTFKFLDSQSYTITSQKAVEIVSSLPEVKSFFTTISNAKISVDEDQNDNKFWMIHVYEPLSDHNSTFNWYQVSKTTGGVVKQI